MNSEYQSIRPVLLAWLSLLALTLLTSLIALVNLGIMTSAISIAIAAIQAIVIGAFLMHAREDGGLVRVIIAGGIIWFLILVTLTMTDYVTRGWLLPSGK